METQIKISELDGKYELLEEVGNGSFSTVHLVRNKEDNKKYVAKILTKDSENFIRETEMNKLVDSPYIIKYLDNGTGHIIINGQMSEKRQYIIMEHASKGCLYDYICPSKEGLGERYGKYMFYKILKGVQECHRKGVCHRDIKLENILLDSNFNPKICDFGFATLIIGYDGQNLLNSCVGSFSYFAPEILSRQRYSGVKADMFSLGVVLIALVTGRPGFLEAKDDDKYYRLIKNKSYRMYWNVVGRKLPNLSDEFKELFLKLVDYDPKNRPSTEEILENSAWLQDIKNISIDQQLELENEIQENFIQREEKIKNFQRN